jgi:beta-galactosidase/beta-glucuronidase
VPTEITDPALWHFDHPDLYQWSVVVAAEDGTVLDQAEETFGIRLIELKDAQFFLNGEPVRLVGLTRHADSPEYGLAEPYTVMAQDYDDLKRLNMVFSRPVHYPQADYILDYCDRNGILLIPEVPSWQLGAFQMGLSTMEDRAKQQLTEMIHEDFNHPSVWAWSVGNEIDSTSMEGHTYVRRMIETAKALDPTRPVSFASNRLNSNPEFDATGLADFVMMNQYFGTWGGAKGGLSDALDAIHAQWPDKVVIISEFGFESRWNDLFGPRGDALTPEDYYFIPEDVSPTGEEADLQRQAVIGEQMAIFRSKPFIAGAVFWTYQDYRTPTDFIMGVVDAERNPRGSWEILRSEFSPVVIDSVDITGSGAAITLHARGPVEVEMPAYTLDGYLLNWVVAPAEGHGIYAEGEIELPRLLPGDSWTDEITWEANCGDCVLIVSIVRHTGFEVLTQMFEFNQ